MLDWPGPLHFSTVMTTPDQLGQLSWWYQTPHAECQFSEASYTVQITCNSEISRIFICLPMAVVCNLLY